MQAVVLFARSPEREAASKRLSGAAPLFRAVIAAWLRAAASHGARPLIACEPRDREALAAIAPEVTREWIEQRRVAFGERVFSAAAATFARGFDSVLIAAIDAPPPLRLGAALAALRNGTAVIGPAHDGGINFIGVTDADRELLTNLTVSRCRVALPDAVIFDAATDVDSSSALHAARREKAWRGYFVIAPVIQSRYVAHALRGVSLPRASRAPPG
jgi:glycosyltransferase A (GT-A) superfamily protein (DUF2064 family)